MALVLEEQIHNPLKTQACPVFVSICIIVESVVTARRLHHANYVLNFIINSRFSIDRKMSDTKEFFLSVTQRIFSNWTALRVSVLLSFVVYSKMYMLFCHDYFFYSILDGSGTWNGIKGKSSRFLSLYDRGYVHEWCVILFCTLLF